MKKNIFSDKLEETIMSNPSFDKINDQISYELLIKHNLTKRKFKIGFSFICLLIVFITSLTIFIPTKNKILSYNDILNSEDFIFSKGATSNFLAFFERNIDMQHRKNNPLQFYKIQTHNLDELYTCAYIPSSYYDEYYNYFNKDSSSEYIYRTRILETYLKDLRYEKQNAKVLWVEYNSIEEIKSSIDDYKIVTILQSRFLTILSNESTNKKLNLKKRLYINTCFTLNNNTITLLDISFDQKLCKLNGDYIVVLPKSVVENNNKAFSFSTYYCFYGIYELKKFNNEDRLYIKSESSDVTYYGKYYDQVMETKIDNLKNEDGSIYNVFDYKRLSEIIYK